MLAPAHATDETGGPEHAPGVFDWFPTHGDRDPVISTLLDAGVPKTGRILDIGCGNSQVCMKLREAGFTRVVGVDFSEVLISNMRKQAPSDSGDASPPGNTQHFFTMDATNLSFSDESFDAVTDKGLLDSVCFDHDHWYQQQKASQRGQPSVQVCMRAACGASPSSSPSRYDALALPLTHASGYSKLMAANCRCTTCSRYQRYNISHTREHTTTAMMPVRRLAPAPPPLPKAHLTAADSMEAKSVHTHTPGRTAHQGTQASTDACAVRAKSGRQATH